MAEPRHLLRSGAATEQSRRFTVGRSSGVLDSEVKKVSEPKTGAFDSNNPKRHGGNSAAAGHLRGEVHIAS